MVIGAPKLNIWGVGAEEGPDFKKFEFDFFPSAIKLPTITCQEEKTTVHITEIPFMSWKSPCAKNLQKFYKDENSS